MAKAQPIQRNYNLEVSGSPRDLGDFQYATLLAVSEKRYGDALKELQGHQKTKNSSRPYEKRTQAIYRHAEELIHAIETKKNFPNISSLTQTKQEEIHHKILENWEDLKICLRRLKSIEREISTEDARSSVWVIKAIIFSFIVIMSVFIINEGFRSFGGSFLTFMKDTFQVGSDSLNLLF